jgi:hypothetical protein
MGKESTSVTPTLAVSVAVTSLAAVGALSFLVGGIPASILGVIFIFFNIYLPGKLVSPKCDYTKVLLEDNTSPQSAPTLTGEQAEKYVRENNKLVLRRYPSTPPSPLRKSPPSPSPSPLSSHKINPQAF